MIIIDSFKVQSNFVKRDWSEEGYASKAKSFESKFTPFDRSTWRDRLRSQEMAGSSNKTWIELFNIITKNQARTNYCWVNGVVYALEAQRVKQGHKYQSFSPASAGAIIKGYRNQGGWGGQACEYIKEHGVAPSELWPDNAIDRQYDNDETRKAREPFKIDEYYDVVDNGMNARERFDRMATALLSGFLCPVAYNWWGHVVCAVDIVWKDGQWFVLCMNSWGASYGEQGLFLLREGKGTPDDCQAIQSIAA